MMANLRAAVLLASLIVVPIIAIIGTDPIIEAWYKLRGKPANPAAQVPVTTAQPSKNQNVEATSPDNRALALNVSAANAEPFPVKPTTAVVALPDAAFKPIANNPPPARERFSAYEQKLRQLGASSYKLEAFDDRGTQYRFECQFRGANSQQPVLFEALDADPVQAVQNVVAQVETAFGSPR